MPYDTKLGGGAIICDAAGNVLARRAGSEGSGIVVADIELGLVEASEPRAAGFWFQELDPLSKVGWLVLGWHGRRWYRRHVAPSGKHE